MKALLLALLLAFPLQAQHSFGWKSSPHGVAGAAIATHPLFKVAPLPTSATIEKWFYRTDQQDRGACVAFSGVEAYDAVHQKDYRGQHVHVSFLDTYQQCLVADGNFPNDTGTYGGTLLRVLQKGVLTEKTWPYSKPLGTLAPNTKKNQKERAAHFTVKSYALPNNDNGYSVKQCIANIRIAALIGTYWANNDFDAREVNVFTVDTNGKRVTVKRFVLPMPNGQWVGGHEIPIVGYDDAMVFPDGSVGGAQIHNHWQGFGDSKGCAWIPYKWAWNQGIVEDCHAIELVGPRKP